VLRELESLPLQNDEAPRPIALAARASSDSAGGVVVDRKRWLADVQGRYVHAGLIALVLVVIASATAGPRPGELTAAPKPVVAPATPRPAAARPAMRPAKKPQQAAQPARLPALRHKPAASHEVPAKAPPEPHGPGKLLVKPPF
jgi:hypothetical protein